jgi:hypothetical protein
MQVMALKVIIEFATGRSSWPSINMECCWAGLKVRDSQFNQILSYIQDISRCIIWKQPLIHISEFEIPFPQESQCSHYSCNTAVHQWELCKFHHDPVGLNVSIVTKSREWLTGCFTMRTFLYKWLYCGLSCLYSYWFEINSWWVHAKVSHSTVSKASTDTFVDLNHCHLRLLTKEASLICYLFFFFHYNLAK